LSIPLSYFKGNIVDNAYVKAKTTEGKMIFITFTNSQKMVMIKNTHVTST